MSLDAKSPAELHRETVEAAIVTAKNEPGKALSPALFAALAALKSNTTTLGDYLELLSALVDANPVLRRREIERAIAAANAVEAAPAAIGEADELTDGIEPWAEPVDGTALADELARRIDLHCSLPAGGAVAVTLWSLAGYTIDSFALFPKLLVRSPLPRCGKSTLVTVIEAITCRALLASSISAAGIFRCTEAWRPTLLLDEADTFLHGDEAMRGIINSGHTRRGAFTVRVEGDAVREPRKFTTWTPMLVAMIGTPPATVLDRSVTLTLQRRKPDEHVERLPRDLFERMASTRRCAMRWAQDHADKIGDAEPIVPAVGNDRAEDNWRTLLAVADTLGGAWPKRARDAMWCLETGEASRAGDESDLHTELLRDVTAILASRPDMKVLPSSLLVSRLNELDERPWPTISKIGKELDARRLAQMLGKFGLRSGTRRIGGDTLKGYSCEAIEKVIARYLPASPALPVTPSQASGNAGSSDSPTVTARSVVTDESGTRARRNGGCDAVTDREGVNGTRSANDAPAELSRAVL